MADKIKYSAEDFEVIFDKSINLHRIACKAEAGKPTPEMLKHSFYTRYQFADEAIKSYLKG